MFVDCASQMGPTDKKAAQPKAVAPVKKAAKKVEKVNPNARRVIEKKIGGEKNGGVRKIVLPRQVSPLLPSASLFRISGITRFYLCGILAPLLSHPRRSS